MSHVAVGLTSSPYQPSPHEDETARLRLSIAAAQERLASFEQRYGVSSEYFIAAMAAEDLEGGDEEYVQWAGEFRLMERLAGKLHRRQSLL